MIKILTTDDLRETKQHGHPDFQLEYYLDDTREYFNNQLDWHWHNEFEIVLVKKGVITFHIGRDTLILNEGEAIFINSKILHQFTAEDYGLLPNIVFAPEFIASKQTVIYQKYVAPVENSPIDYVILKIECKWQNQILSLLAEMFLQLSSGKFHELQIRNILCEAWLILTEHIQPLISETSRRKTAGSSYNSVMVMIQYIRSHYMESISLEDISSVAKISKNTAIRYFNANIAMSPVDYLIKCRISTACKLLKETADKISHIALSVGYENTGYFCRLFKKCTGLSPKEYRQTL